VIRIESIRDSNRESECSTSAASILFSFSIRYIDTLFTNYCDIDIK